MFLEYKAEQCGKIIAYVDARYTSQKCSCCKIVSKENRNKSKYQCKICKFNIHADWNAAINIKDNYILSSTSKASEGQAVVNPPPEGRNANYEASLNVSTQVSDTSLQPCSCGCLEAAAVLKRRYHGLGFTTKIKKFDGFTPETIKDFIGHQYFFDLYYNFKPLNLEMKASVGQFFAKDRGLKFELTRYYPSGMRFSIWYSLTTANDIVNGSRYHDKGIAFFIPFDFFLKKSSR